MHASSQNLMIACACQVTGRPELRDSAAYTPQFGDAVSVFVAGTAVLFTTKRRRVMLDDGFEGLVE
jgi:NaMN:DMB phosphoribosyltransferase